MESCSSACLPRSAAPPELAQGAGSSSTTPLGSPHGPHGAYSSRAPFSIGTLSASATEPRPGGLTAEGVGVVLRAEIRRVATREHGHGIPGDHRARRGDERNDGSGTVLRSDRGDDLHTDPAVCRTDGQLNIIRMIFLIANRQNPVSIGPARRSGECVGSGAAPHASTRGLILSVVV